MPTASVTTKMKKKELTGKRFGRLLVLRLSRGTRHGLKWSCLCDCGAKKVIYGHSLTTGRTTSCGCYHDECSRKPKRHGSVHSPEYKVWGEMIQRCYNPANKHFKNYGGRGISVCFRWQDFLKFIDDIGMRLSSKHSIERRNNNGDYKPSNCYWATRQEQQNNMRTNRRLTHDGRTQTVAQWARELNIKYATLYGRSYAGWSDERALTESVR